MNEALGLATIDGTLRTSAWRGASYSRWAIVGLYWSNVYEHLAWKRIRRATSASPVAARIGSAR